MDAVQDMRTEDQVVLELPNPKHGLTTKIYLLLQSWCILYVMYSDFQVLFFLKKN